MSLLGRLGEKSWENPGASRFEEPADYRPAALQVGLYVYFAVASVIFSLMVTAYLMRMAIHGAMGHPSTDWRPMPEPLLLWVNTAILVLSSAAWVAAQRQAPALFATGGVEKLRRATLAGGLLGIVFLAGQLLLWRQFQAAGFYLSANPANAFFYMLTATHGLHLAGGIAASLRVLSHPTVMGVRLCAIYWHFLLLVWVLLAGLLVLT